MELLSCSGLVPGRAMSWHPQLGREHKEGGSEVPPRPARAASTPSPLVRPRKPCRGEVTAPSPGCPAGRDTRSPRSRAPRRLPPLTLRTALPAGAAAGLVFGEARQKPRRSGRRAQRPGVPGG